MLLFNMPHGQTLRSEWRCPVHAPPRSLPWNPLPMLLPATSTKSPSLNRLAISSGLPTSTEEGISLSYKEERNGRGLEGGGYTGRRMNLTLVHLPAPR